MSEESEVIIRLEGLKKVFYTDEVETHALSDIHLEIRKGEFLAVAGPSGCGKSTLLSTASLTLRGLFGKQASCGMFDSSFFAMI